MPEFIETTYDKFTFRFPTDRVYSAEGTWVLPLAPGRVRVGVGDYVQQRSGDVATLSVKAGGTALEAGDEFAEVETVKANVSLASPVAGKIVEVNAKLAREPELVNTDPYGEGWLATIEASSWEKDRAALQSPEAYLAFVNADAAKEGS